jgi:hypothetical protein
MQDFGAESSLLSMAKAGIERQIVTAVKERAESVFLIIKKSPFVN